MNTAVPRFLADCFGTASGTPRILRRVFTRRLIISSQTSFVQWVASAIPGIRGTPISITGRRSEEHTSELQSLMRISYAVFCLKKKNKTNKKDQHIIHNSNTIQ